MQQRSADLVTQPASMQQALHQLASLVEGFAHSYRRLEGTGHILLQPQATNTTCSALS